VEPEDAFLLFADRDRHGPTTGLVLRDTTVGLPTTINLQRVDGGIRPVTFLDRNRVVRDGFVQCGRLVLPTGVLI